MASKDSNEDEVKKDQDNSEDNFGLPDVEFKPLDQSGDAARASREEVTSASGYVSDTGSAGDSSYDAGNMDEPKSKAPIILGIVIVLVLVIAGYLIYNFVYKPKAEAERVKKEQMAKASLLKKQQDEEARLAKQREDDERKRLEELAKVPAIGTIDTLTQRTGRYYVVVTSDIDDDLLMDYARKLSAKGVSTKIIPPYGGKKFYRLAIADHDSFATAQTNADASKADYGSGLWVIKY